MGYGALWISSQRMFALAPVEINPLIKMPIFNLPQKLHLAEVPFDM